MVFLIILLMLGGVDTDECRETYDERKQLLNILQSDKEVFFQSVKDTPNEQKAKDMFMANDEENIIRAKECVDKSNVATVDASTNPITSSQTEEKIVEKSKEIESSDNDSVTIQCQTDPYENDINVEIKCSNKTKVTNTSPNSITANTIVTAIVVGGAAVIGIWGTERRRSSNISKKSRNTLKIGIQRLEKQFKNMHEDKIVNYNEMYLNEILSTHHFDGVVASGAFILLDDTPIDNIKIEPQDAYLNIEIVNLQTDIENVYFQIKQHNYRLHALEKLHDKIILQTTRSGEEKQLLSQHIQQMHDIDEIIQSQIRILKSSYSFFNF